MIGITSEQAARVESILSGIQGGPEKAFFNVINRALDTVRVETGRQIREVYAIAQKDLRAESNIRMKKASAGDLVGEIAFSGGTIPLYRFNVTPKQPTPTQRTKVKAAALQDEAGNSVDGPTNVGTYTLTITGVTDGNYTFDGTDGKNTAEFEILPAGQTPLTITGTRERVYYGDTIQLGTTGGNGTVTWQVDNGPASIDKDTGLLTITGVG